MMKKAYLGVRSKMKEEQRYEETCRMSSASVMVINGEKLVIANIGNYRVVVCKDGMAHQKVDTYQQSGKRHWSRRIFSGINDKQYINFTCEDSFLCQNLRIKYVF
jgi:protein phosphatase PTC1